MVQYGLMKIEKQYLFDHDSKMANYLSLNSQKGS